MRRHFLLLLATLTAAAALAWLVRLDAGYVLLQFRSTRVETTLWFALALLLVTLVVFYYGARLLLVATSALARLGGAPPRRAPRRFVRSPSARGAQALVEGHWSNAARLLAAGARGSDAPLLNYVLAARAAARAGDLALARGFLAIAGEMPGGATAVAIERARLDLQAGEPAAALEALDALGDTRHPAAIDVLLDVLPACGAWVRVLDALGEARRLAVRPADALDALEMQACTALLQQAGNNAERLREAWDSFPRSARSRPAQLAHYARALSAAGAGAQALDLLESALAKEWDVALVRALGQVRGADAVKQLARAERMLARHPADAELLLALGRIALSARLWAKARDYLDSSLARTPRAETCAELARACEHTGDAERARTLRERAVVMALGES